MLKAMTEEKLKEIEARWANWIDKKSPPKSIGGDLLLLLAEVRRLNRMVDKACGLLEMSEDSHIDDIGWRKYLESEVGKR